MQIESFLKPAGFLAAVFAVFCWQNAAAQQTPAVTESEGSGLAPRATPGDYHSQAKAGAITFAVDFAGHGVPAGENVFTTDAYIVVEVGIYGAPGSHLNLSYKDFTLKVNGKKSSMPAQPYEAVFKSLKDPDWIPPDTGEKKSAGGLSAGADQNEPAPAPPKMPMNLQLAMEQKVRKAAIAEGERPLPEAGLLFFQNGGKISSFRSIELVYNGAAGKVTLPLVP